MATRNDITGDALISKSNNDNYRNNYDLIFGKSKKAAETVADCSGSQGAVGSAAEYETGEKVHTVDPQAAAAVDGTDR